MSKVNRSAYEKNWLLKHGFNLDQLEQFGAMPVEYITGFAQFYSREFVVNKNVLIPRIESERIVEMGVEFLLFLKNNQPISILDVGTGSGNIGLSLFLELSAQLENTEIFADLTDISAEALQVARKNLQRLVAKEKQTQINLIQSDLLTDVPDKKYQLILANLPYVPTALLKTVDNSVKYYESQLALDGGEDGLFLVRRFLNQIEPYLDSDGIIMLEVDERAKITSDSLGIFNEQMSFTINYDQFEKQRFVIIKKIVDDCQKNIKKVE